MRIAYILCNKPAISWNLISWISKIVSRDDKAFSLHNKIFNVEKRKSVLNLSDRKTFIYDYHLKLFCHISTMSNNNVGWAIVWKNTKPKNIVTIEKNIYIEAKQVFVKIQLLNLFNYIFSWFWGILFCCHLLTGLYNFWILKCK